MTKGREKEEEYQVTVEKYVNQGRRICSGNSFEIELGWREK